MVKFTKALNKESIIEVVGLV